MDKDDGPSGTVETKTVPPLRLRSLAPVLMHADAVDVALMVLGLAGAMGGGIATPIMIAIAGRIFNDTGSGPDHVQQFRSRMNEQCNPLDPIWFPGIERIQHCSNTSGKLARNQHYLWVQYEKNIVYCTETTTEAEIENVTRYVNGHDFISNLKDGYATCCGERCTAFRRPKTMYCNYSRHHEEPYYLATG